MSYIPPTPFTPGKLISAATTNSTSVKTVPTIIGWIAVSQIGSSAAFLKIYDKASAPTVGTDTPVQTYVIPGNINGAGSNLPVAGMKLSNGFAFAITSGMADSDTSTVAAGQVAVSYGTANA